MIAIHEVVAEKKFSAVYVLLLDIQRLD